MFENTAQRRAFNFYPFTIMVINSSRIKWWPVRNACKKWSENLKGRARLRKLDVGS
jgi:hypothetical protein